MTTFLGGLAAGAMGMYLLDPRQGRRRRARARDKLVRLEHLGGAAVTYGQRDLVNRARGLVAELRGRLRAGPVDDEILVERVRARIGRVVSHPHAIEVRAHDGVVTLGGRILAPEAAGLLACARGVRGVDGVLDCLERFADAAGTPALQGEGRRVTGYRPPWPTAARVAAATLGGAMVLGGLAKPGPGGLVGSGLGAFLLLHGLTGLSFDEWAARAVEPRLHQLMGSRAGRRAASTEGLIH